MATNATTSFFTSLKDGSYTQKIGRSFYFVVRTFTEQETAIMDNHVNSGNIGDIVFTNTGDVTIEGLYVPNPTVTDDVRALGGRTLAATQFGNKVFTWGLGLIISPNHLYILVRDIHRWKVCYNHIHSAAFDDAVKAATSIGKNKPFGLTYGSGSTKNLRGAFETHCNNLKVPGPRQADGEESYLDVTCHSALSSKQCTESMFQENLVDYTGRPDFLKQIEKGALMLSVSAPTSPPRACAWASQSSIRKRLLSIPPSFMTSSRVAVNVM